MNRREIGAAALAAAALLTARPSQALDAPRPPLLPPVRIAMLLYPGMTALDVVGPQGLLAGLTVYAVPQVLAATVPVGLLATQVGTLVKLVRVLMLGPVVVAFALIAPHLPVEGATTKAGSRRLGFSKLVPWFIIGFLVLAAFRSLGLVPEAIVPLVTRTAALLTVISMAALGLGVDVRVLARVGGRVILAVTGSLALLLAVSLVLIHALRIA